MFVSTAWAQGGGAGGGADALSAFLPLILIFAIFYFLLIRPQQKKQKQHQAKLQSIRRGDKVLTGGGVFGTVTKVLDENEIQVEIAEGVKVRAAKNMVADVLSKTEPADGGAPANDAGGGGLLGSLFSGFKGGAKPQQPAADDGKGGSSGNASGAKSGGKKAGGKKGGGKKAAAKNAPAREAAPADDAAGDTGITDGESAGGGESGSGESGRDDGPETPKT